MCLRLGTAAIVWCLAPLAGISLAGEGSNSDGIGPSPSVGLPTNLSLALSAVSLISAEGPEKSPVARASDLERAGGAISRGPRDRRCLALVFTGHEFAEGGPTILDALAKRKAKASFFLTGDFLAKAELDPLVRRIIAEGHYLGPHSDKHLLYCEWTARKQTLVSKYTFATDLRANVVKIARLGAEPPRYFLPPYEHFNNDIAAWTSELGLQLINYTPGTRSNADYMEDGAARYISSRAILESIIDRERTDPDGLNGFLLLLHLGAGPKRSDKFHPLFGELLEYLAGKGYELVRVDELLGAESKSK
jgi:peptidoglycan/xylan/chitin deacetylase (PgdA/CDA1 family)